MQLGRLGAWYSTDKLGGPSRSSHSCRPSSAWATTRCGIPNRAAMNLSRSPASCWRNTTKLKLGSSIAVDLCARRVHLAARPALLQALYGDRFILGLGVSHVPMVEGIRGHKYEKPVPAMRAYLDGITKGEAGSRQLADRHRGTRSADAEAVGEPYAWRAAVQHHAAAHGRGRTHIGAEQVAGGGAEGYT